MDAIKIVIADNQYLTKTGLIRFLQELTVKTEIEEASNKEELFDILKKITPRLLIVDYDIFDFNTLEELSNVRNISPETTVVVFTNNIEPQNIEKIVELNISNYVLKTSEKDELEAAFHAALNNKKYYSEEVLDLLVSKKTKQKPSQISSHLTHAETEIIKLIAQGLTTKEIAAKKYLSFHTIITHRKNIFRKLAINNTSELVMFAIRSGIVDTTEYYI